MVYLKRKLHVLYNQLMEIKEIVPLQTTLEEDFMLLRAWFTIKVSHIWNRMRKKTPRNVCRIVGVYLQPIMIY